jgi:hypothetical protein
MDRVSRVVYFRTLLLGRAPVNAAADLQHHVAARLATCGAATSGVIQVQVNNLHLRKQTFCIT